MKTPSEIRSWLDTARKAFPGSSLVALSDLVTSMLAARHASDHAATEADHLEAEVTFDAACAALAEAVGCEPPPVNIADARLARDIRNLPTVDPPDGWQGEVLDRIRQDRGDS